MATETLSPHKPKVTISKELSAQISYLHDQCPKNKEWSGLLIYEVTNGSINDLANLEIKAHAVFPMDFGDATFTSFEAGEGWISAFSQFPQIDPLTPTPGWYLGKVHSHHNMSVYHSPTDKTDLHDTAPNLPMFLSLIVNYKVETDCELAIAIEAEEEITTKISWKLKGWSEKKEESKVDRPVSKRVYVMKCEVAYEQEDWFKSQIEAVRTENARKFAYTPPYTGYKPPQSTPVSASPGYTYGKQGKKKNKGKHGIVHSTDIRGAIEAAGVKEYTPKTYQKMLAEAADLFTLGLGHTLTPYEALKKADLDVAAYNRTEFQKAFVYFFMEVWYPVNFYSQMDEDEIAVIKAIRDLMRSHKQLWIESVISQCLNQLEALLETRNEQEAREDEEEDARLEMEMY